MQTRIDPSAKSARYWFDSLAELSRYIETEKPTWHTRSSVTELPEPDWDLCAGYHASWDMARNGWNAGAQQAKTALKVFKPMTAKPETKNDFYGFRPHMPRYCAGDPAHMIRKAPSPQGAKGRIRTIVVPVNAKAHVDARYMQNFGLGVAQYINQLETAEHVRVEIIGAIVSSVSDWRVSHCWRIKAPDQPLDLAVLAFAIGHPAMFRRLGFALRERCPAPQDYSYGQSKAVELADVINCPRGALILNGMKDANEVAQTPADALAFIETALGDAMP